MRQMRPEGESMLERVLRPRGRRMVTARPLARRVDTLAGKTVAQVWDDLFRGSRKRADHASEQ